MAITRFKDGSTLDTVTGVLTPATPQANQNNTGLLDFTSQDPAIKNQIAQMQQQVYQKSSVPQMASSVFVPPAPPGTNFTPNYNNQPGQPGGVVAPGFQAPKPLDVTGGASGGLSGGVGGSGTGLGGGSGVGGGQGSQAAFGSIFGDIMAKAQDRQYWIDQKSKILQHLYDHALTTDEMNGMPQSVQQILQSNNPALAGFAISLLNDQIKGRTDANMASLQYMMMGYQDDQARLQKQQDEMNKRNDLATAHFMTMIDRMPDMAASMSPEGFAAIQQGRMPPAEDIAKVYQAYKDSLAGLKLTATTSSAGKKFVPQTKYQQGGVFDGKTGKFQPNTGSLVKGTGSTGNGNPTTKAGSDLISFISQQDNKNQSLKALGGLSVNGLTEAAKLYMTQNGKMPSLGLGQNADVKTARLAVINYAAYLADSLGTDVPSISAAYGANKKAISDNVGRIARIESTSKALTAQFPRLVQLATSVSDLGITESDLTAGKVNVSRKFGSVDAGNYVELLQTIRGDYSAMQAALAGSRGGQFFSEGAREAIPIGLTSEQYAGIQDTIDQSAKNSLRAVNEEVQQLLSNTPSSSVQSPNKASDQSSGSSNTQSADDIFNSVMGTH